MSECSPFSRLQGNGCCLTLGNRLAGKVILHFVPICLSKNEQFVINQCLYKSMTLRLKFMFGLRHLIKYFISRWFVTATAEIGRILERAIGSNSEFFVIDF